MRINKTRHPGGHGGARSDRPAAPASAATWPPSTSASAPAPTSRRCCRGSRATLCDAPHWGYILAGELVVTYADGTHRPLHDRGLLLLAAGHSVRVEQDAEVILFSPHAAHAAVIDHMKAKLATM